MKLAIIDFNRTIYDPDAECLSPGALELLEALAARGVRMVLFSRDEGAGERVDVLEALGVKQFFAEAVFVKTKNAAAIIDIMARHGATREETFVLGDYIYQEIRAGNQAGVRTIQYKQGALADREPEIPDDVPKMVVGHLKEAIALIA